MNKLPLACNTDVVVQNLGKEVLIYDIKRHKAYNLNETSAIVYNACDGKTAFDELKAKHKFTDDIIFLALDELKRENLIEDNDSLVSPFAGMSRREVIRKVGMGSLIALPLVLSLVAPTAAHAQSVCNTGASCTCTFPAGPAPSACSSGVCTGGCDCVVGSCFPGADPETQLCLGSCGGAPVIG